jgi:hypothetical protein
VISPVLLTATNIRRQMQGIKPLVLESALIEPANTDVFNSQTLRVRVWPFQDLVRFDCPQVKESAESIARVKKEGSIARKNRR